MFEQHFSSYNSNIEGYYFTDEWWIYKAYKVIRNCEGRLHSFKDKEGNILPAIIFYNNDGTRFREEWYDNGILHNDQGPAVIDYYMIQIPKIIEYRNNTLLHRMDGPAQIGYTNNGKIFYEEYYKEGKLHNEKGPAKINYYNDKICAQYYYVENVLHRLDGPAVIMNEDSIPTPNKIEYYILGKPIHNNYNKISFILKEFIRITRKIRRRNIYLKLWRTSFKKSGTDLCYNICRYLV